MSKQLASAKMQGNYIIHGVITFTSVVQILDYVDKNHMNNHYFCCSHLNKLKIKNNKKISFLQQQDELGSPLSFPS